MQYIKFKAKYNILTVIDQNLYRNMSPHQRELTENNSFGNITVEFIK